MMRNELSRARTWLQQCAYVPESSLRGHALLLAVLQQRLCDTGEQSTLQALSKQTAQWTCALSFAVSSVYSATLSTRLLESTRAILQLFALLLRLS